MTAIVEPARSAPLIDPWPGSPGGAYNAAWGESIRLFVQASIASGTNWHIGPHVADKLDQGNVIGHVVESGTAPGLWVDMACDTVSVDVTDGTTATAGILARDEAATVTIVLFDPAREWDPTNTTSPYWYGGRTRLHAGTPIRVFAEVLDPTGDDVVTVVLFEGRSDLWSTPVARDPADRRTTITATGAVKEYVGQDYAETGPVGAGDTTAQRLDRLRTYFNLRGPLEQVGVASDVTLAATTLAQSAWELLNRTIDDELGYLHVLPDGTLRWWTRNVWQSGAPAPVVTLGCAPGVDAWDIATDSPLGTDASLLVNAVYASRSGGTQQVARSSDSVAAHGGIESTVTRTDLGLADDAQVATWAQTLVTLFAFPAPSPGSVSFVPALEGEVDGSRWRPILGVDYITDTVRIVWAPHDGTGTLDRTVRVVGSHHQITTDDWQVEWQVLPARLAPSANVWTIGPDPFDKLDDGNVIGWLSSSREVSDAA